MKLSSLLATGALTVAASVGAQDAGKLNGTVQISAGKIVDQTTPNNLPKGGEDIRHFNKELSDLMGTVRAGVEKAVTQEPAGPKKEFASLFAEKKYTIGDMVITSGIGRIGTTEGRNPYGLRFSIK